MNRTFHSFAFHASYQRTSSKNIWADTLLSAAHIWDRIPIRSIQQNTAPRLRWTDCFPDPCRLCVLGEKCWYVIPKSKVKRLDPWSRESVMTGCASNSKGYKLWYAKLEMYIVFRYWYLMNWYFILNPKSKMKTIGHQSQLSVLKLTLKAIKKIIIFHRLRIKTCLPVRMRKKVKMKIKLKVKLNSRIKIINLILVIMNPK